eukprot:gene6933-14072_t
MMSKPIACNENGKAYEHLAGLAGICAFSGRQNYRQAIFKAMKSISLYPLPILTVEDAMQLHGVGPSLAREIMKGQNKVSEPTTVNSDIIADKSKIGKRTRDEKYYPEKGKGPWSVLLCLYKCNGKSTRKADIMLTAATLTQEGIDVCNIKACWSNAIKTLQSKSLILSENGIYQLSNEGISVVNDLIDSLGINWPKMKLNIHNENINEIQIRCDIDDDDFNEDDGDNYDENSNTCLTQQSSVTSKSHRFISPSQSPSIRRLCDRDTDRDRDNSSPIWSRSQQSQSTSTSTSTSPMMSITHGGHTNTNTAVFDMTTDNDDEDMFTIDCTQSSYISSTSTSIAPSQIIMNISNQNNMNDNNNIRKEFSNTQPGGLFSTVMNSNISTLRTTTPTTATTNTTTTSRTTTSAVKHGIVTNKASEMNKSIHIQKEPIQKEMNDYFISTSTSTSTVISTSNEPDDGLIRVRGDEDVILLVDNREKDSALIQASMIEAGYQCEVSTLSLGDFLWVIRLHDCIVERKTSADLASSIMDGRYSEQKQRLCACGINTKIYIVEGLTLNVANFSNITATALKTAM